MRFRLIDAAKEEFPVRRLCKVLGVSQSGYFAWRSRPACRRQRDDLVLLAHVRSAFRLSNETYGSPRMTRELQDQGLHVGRRRTARLMRENGLRARQPRRFKRTTDSLHAFPVAPNLIEQDFAAERPDEKWGSDLSYIWTREGWLYLAVVIDLYARRVVGWAVSDRLHKELALAALRRALVVRRPSAGLIHHSDRGSQYCSTEHQAELRKHGILISMSGKGNCYDNAMVETFFKTLKSELVCRTAFQTRAEASEALARYADGFFIPVRRHSALDFISPAQFERAAKQTALHEIKAGPNAPDVVREPVHLVACDWACPQRGCCGAAPGSDELHRHPRACVSGRRASGGRGCARPAQACSADNRSCPLDGSEACCPSRDRGHACAPIRGWGARL